MGRNHVATVLAVLVAISKVSASVFDFLVQSHNYDGVSFTLLLVIEIPASEILHGVMCH